MKVFVNIEFFKLQLQLQIFQLQQNYKNWFEKKMLFYTREHTILCYGIFKLRRS